MQRSLIEFESTLKAEATKEAYRYFLDNFRTWADIKDYDSILELNDKEIYEKLTGYIQHLKDLVNNSQLSANSVPKYFGGIKHFLIMNDRVFNWDKMQKMYPAKKKESGSEAYSTEQIKQIFSFAKSARTKFIILFLCSTGARIGALASIKLADIKKIDNIHCITLYAGEVEEAICFLTPEATQAFDTYLKERERDGEKLNPQSPLFRSEYRLGIEKVRPATKKGLEAIVYRLIHKAVIERTKTGTRYNIQADHGFRKWYKIQIANTHDIPFEMSKKLIHHKDLEGRYNAAKPELLLTHFKKAVQNLTIDDTQRNQLQIAYLQDETNRLKVKEAEIESLQSEIKTLKERQGETYTKEQMAELIEFQQSLGKSIDMILASPEKQKQYIHDLTENMIKRVREEAEKDGEVLSD